VTVVATILVLLAPVALIYGWVCYFTPPGDEPPSWRRRATLLSLVLVSLAILLWPVIMALKPGADWGTGTGVGYQVAWVYARTRTALCILLIALLLGLFGRPRLIFPIVLACTGTGLFWLFSTMP
jgi:hypothetical protein